MTETKIALGHMSIFSLFLDKMHECVGWRLDNPV